ncbi:MAG: Mut7-C RNAse domain-containing protein, partial [bacterium]
MKFVCDRNLGSLARWLRILGFDTSYPDLPDDESLADLAASQSRILLT